MAQSQVDAIHPGSTVACYEQRIAAGNQFDGNAPELSATPFLLWFDSTNGIVKSGNAAGSVFAGDKGGLFSFAHKQPIVIDQVLGDLGAVVTYTIGMTNETDTAVFYNDTSRYVRLFTEQDKAILMPGESLQFITTGASTAMWLRVYARLLQCIR